ncbi:hypothetical protein [Pseudobacillus badius]|uniref:hypothetical protein n=1 Tax=Bacillus badius TaxID=1455 RepID=UPI003D341558
MQIEDFPIKNQMREWATQYEKSAGFGILLVNQYWEQTKNSEDVVFLAVLRGVSPNEFSDYYEEFVGKSERKEVIKKICEEHTLWSKFDMSQYDPQKISNFKMLQEEKLAGYIMWGVSKYAEFYYRNNAMSLYVRHPEKKERASSGGNNNTDGYNDYSDVYEYMINHN